jgi:ribosomal-protein-alanine N-acetyltransferase
VTEEEIRLVPLGPEHADAMDALARDDGVARFTRVPSPPPPGFGSRWVERYTRGRDDQTNAAFAIVDGRAAFVGFAALVQMNLAEQEAEAGYIVASSARGRGIATSALGRLTDWAFSELPLERIELLIDVDNAASEVVAERCGYTREGILRSKYVKPGLRADLAVYSLLRHEL